MQEKKSCKTLIHSDITQSDFELPDIQFDLTISNAVFHMIGDFFHIIKKATQHLKTNGHLCFTVIPFDKTDEKHFKKSTRQGIYYNHKKEIDLYVFRHTISYIYYVLKENKLQLISNQVFLAFTDFHEKRDVFFEFYHAIKR
ncbi:MAG: class I SAM-dependent methyltransferase [Chloroflexia bacterium]|nr:class I SAM-dependent methyltransferase [Chloroflexia bacterium]